MKDYSVTYRISPALFAEYCYFSLFRMKYYRIARSLGLAVLACAGIITAVLGFLYKDMNIAIFGAVITLITVMIPFVQKKFIKSRYKLVYGKELTKYTASFGNSGSFTLSAGEITEKYGKQDITVIYLIKGGYAVNTNRGTFLVPLADTLPDIEWFKKTYGKKIQKMHLTKGMF